MPKVIIAGCGFLGEAAAVLFLEAGWQVLGLCATEESAHRLQRRPFAVRVQDISKEFRFDLPWRGADALIHCASSGRGGAEAYRAVYLEGLLNAITAIQPRRTIFVSSTSVYGQTDGSVVDEMSEAAPERETARILLEAEGVALAAGGYVARLSGLYGPGRSVLLQKMLAGDAGSEDRWVNQIHRDDAARALRHLLQNRVETGIYNVTDDTPATLREVNAWLADFLKKPLPPEAEPNRERKRAWTSKRVSNAKLRATGWSPIYPDYRSALPSLTSA